jgi:hypothetical protein
MSSDMLQLMGWMDSKFTHLASVTVTNLHETRELRREVSEMSKRKSRTHGLTRQLLSPALIPWYVALALTATGHFVAADLKEMITRQTQPHMRGLH